jgi:hypothetical protein
MAVKAGECGVGGSAKTSWEDASELGESRLDKGAENGGESPHGPACESKTGGGC